MAWYSYFLLCIPEALAVILLTFTLLGISLKENSKSIMLFAFIYGLAAFILNIFLVNSLKPILTLIFFSILASYLFKRKLLDGFIIGLISFVCLILFELTFSILYTSLFNLNYDYLLTHPWQRILVSAVTTTIPMLLVAFILYKKNYSIKISLLKS